MQLSTPHQYNYLGVRRLHSLGADFTAGVKGLRGCSGCAAFSEFRGVRPGRLDFLKVAGLSCKEIIRISRSCICTECKDGCIESTGHNGAVTCPSVQVAWASPCPEMPSCFLASGHSIEQRFSGCLCPGMRALEMASAVHCGSGGFPNTLAPAWMRRQAVCDV